MLDAAIFHNCTQILITLNTINKTLCFMSFPLYSYIIAQGDSWQIVFTLIGFKVKRLPLVWFFLPRPNKAVTLLGHFYGININIALFMRFLLLKYGTSSNCLVGCICIINKVSPVLQNRYVLNSHLSYAAFALLQYTVIKTLSSWFYIDPLKL